VVVVVVVSIFIPVGPFVVPLLARYLNIGAEGFNTKTIYGASWMQDKNHNGLVFVGVFEGG